MTWVKVDDAIWSHRKLRAAGPESAWLFICGLGWCNQNLSDGLIPTYVVGMLTDIRKPDQAAQKLVEVGLWHRADDDHYAVHDFLDYQPSKSQVESQRDAQRERQKKSRQKRGVTDGVSADTPTRPDPTPSVNGSTSDDYQTSPPNGSSSLTVGPPPLWTDAELYAEAGRICARDYTGTFSKGEDAYATGAARKIRRERAHLVSRLRGFPLEQAAELISRPDAAETLSVFDVLDDEFSPADSITAGEAQ